MTLVRAQSIGKLRTRPGRPAQGSHFALYDDQLTYFRGLVQFVQDVDAGRF